MCASSTIIVSSSCAIKTIISLIFFSDISSNNVTGNIVKEVESESIGTARSSDILVCYFLYFIIVIQERKLRGMWNTIAIPQLIAL